MHYCCPHFPEHSLLTRPTALDRILCTAVALALLVVASAGAQSATADSPIERAAATHVQPGDRMVVHIVGEPLLSDTVTVNERGQVPLAKLGVVDVEPYTIAALQDTLRARYAKYLRTPAVEIVVLRRLSVGGEVMKPNLYFVDIATTLREAIARAGGMTENASRGNVYIIRDARRIPVPDWESNDSRVSDLQSGDQVMVGRKNWWSINALPAVSTLVVVASLLISLKR